MCNSGNSGTWNIKNPRIFRTLKYLKSHTCAESSQRLNMECFTKIVESYNYFSEAHYLKSLTSFWIRPSLNKYSLWLTSHNALYETYSEPCHIQNLYMSRNQNRHILTYSECYVTLAYWEHCHVQNFNSVYLGIFRHIQAHSIMIVIITSTSFFLL